MVNQSVPEWFREEKEKLRSMSPQKRLEYLWGYYRYHALAVLAAVVILAFLIQGKITANQQVLISGVLINTDTSEAGYQHLSQDYWQLKGSDPWARADIIETLTIRYSRESPDSSNFISMVDALIAAKELDYMILDETALEFYGPLDTCMDLSVCLPEQLLSRLEGQLRESYSIERQQNYFAAIDLTGSAFAEEYGLSAKPSYLVVVANTPRSEEVIPFLDYLLGIPGQHRNC